jgi:hypothetical protein
MAEGIARKIKKYLWLIQILNEKHKRWP